MISTAKMDKPTLVTITNNLCDGYKELEKGTFQEASEVQNQRRKDPSLRSIWIYTANLPLFRIQDDCLEYGLSGRQTFDSIAGEDIDDFTKQILQTGAYNLTPQQEKQLEDLTADIVWAKAADLALTKENDEWSYFIIDTSDAAAAKLNDEQRRFAVKVHGSSESKFDPKQSLPDYAENMNMLLKEGKIKQTRLWLPNPNHIKSYLNNKCVVARACWLGNFDSISLFRANYRDVNFHFALCGVHNKVGEADTQKMVTLSEQSLHDLLGKYVAPVALDLAIKDITKLYQ